jgi:hypothetical protein
MFHNQRNRARRPVSRVLSRPCAYTWAGMAIPLGHPLPSASCNRPERQREGPAWHPKHAGVPAAPTWSCSRWGFPCRRRCRRRGALLPHHFTLAARRVSRDGPAVYFLWHFPWGRPRRALPGTAPPWSPDFPLPARSGKRPSGRLASRHLGTPALLVKGRRLIGHVRIGDRREIPISIVQ